MLSGCRVSEVGGGGCQSSDPKERHGNSDHLRRKLSGNHMNKCCTKEYCEGVEDFKKLTSADGCQIARVGGAGTEIK